MCRFAINRLDKDIGIIKVTISGQLPQGSHGNSIVAEWVDKIEKELSLNETVVSGLIIDLHELKYVFGDSIASLWIPPSMREIPCALIAVGRTRKAIENLFNMSISIPLAKDDSEALSYLGT